MQQKIQPKINPFLQRVIPNCKENFQKKKSANQQSVIRLSANQ